jgi:hypothetical protein
VQAIAGAFANELQDARLEAIGLLELPAMNPGRQRLDLVLLVFRQTMRVCEKLDDGKELVELQVAL